MQDRPILVIGATGKTGRRVASRLKARGLPVSCGSRSSATPFDWEAPETWAPALRGARAAYVTYFPDLAFPGAVEKLESFCETARDVATEHLVLLSGRGEHHARLGEEVVRNPEQAEMHEDVLARLGSSGRATTSVRGRLRRVLHPFLQPSCTNRDRRPDRRVPSTQRRSAYTV